MKLLGGLQNCVKSSLLLILIASASWIVAGCNGSSGGPVVIPTPAPFTFPQPEVRESSGGMLKTTLHARIADNMMVDQFLRRSPDGPYAYLRGDHSGAHPVA